MNFIKGFSKTAGFVNGLRAAGKETIQDALQVKGLRDSVKQISGSYSGKMKQLLNTKEGRKDLSHAIAKSLPSAGALGAYGYVGKKMYDATKKDSQNQYDQMYYS